MTFFLSGLEQVFGWLLSASWQASVLALFVLLIQWILGSRLNPRWRYALWLLVLLRLVLPVEPESALSLFQFTPSPPATFTVSVTEPLFTPAPIPPDAGPATELSEPSHPFSFYSLLAVVWFAGAGAWFLLTWIINRRFARQVADSPEITDPELLRLFAESKTDLGIRRCIRLIENGQVQSPAIMGLFQPTLLLPANVRQKFDAHELRLIFLHELAHLRRGDVTVQALIAMLQILHWFNPLLWLAFRRMRIDREPATDALVLSRAGEQEKERYGLMLIKLLEHFNQRHSLPTLVGILEDRDQFKRRFALIARFTRGAYGWSLLGFLLIGFLSTICLTRSKATVPAAMTAPADQAGFPGKELIRIEAKVAQIGEDDYQARRAEIDSALQKGDVATLSNLPTFKLFTQMVALSKSGERSVMENIRVFPYPIAFTKDKDGNVIPTDFKRQNLGVRLPSTASFADGKISATGELEVTTLQGIYPGHEVLGVWESEFGPIHLHDPKKEYEPVFNTRRMAFDSVAFEPGQTIGFLGANLQPDFSDPEAAFGPNEDDRQPKRSKGMFRLILFLNAQIKPAAPTSTEPPTSGPSGTNTTPFSSTSTTDVASAPQKPGVKITADLIEIDRKDYDRQAKAMDEAVQAGNLSFFKDRITKSPAVVLRVNQNGWISDGEVQSYIASVKKGNDGAVTLQSQAIFYGLNADFKWVGNAHIDSNWQVSVPLGFDQMVVSPDIPKSTYPAGLRVPRLLLTSFIDKDWDPASEKTHGFWVGETQGWIKARNEGGSYETQIKRETPSKLAVFLTAKPAVTDAAKATVPAQATPVSGIAATDLLSVRTFLVPQGFFRTTPIDHADVKPDLIGHGIAFGTGATAIYLASSGKLVVRNTPEQLDKLATLIQAAYPSESKEKATNPVQTETKLIDDMSEPEQLTLNKPLPDKYKGADYDKQTLAPPPALSISAAAPHGLVLTGYVASSSSPLPSRITMAIDSGDYEAVKTLLDQGETFGADDMQMALRDGRLEIARLLWEHGPHYCSELAYAISQDEPLPQIKELLDRGASVTSAEDRLVTPLGLAAQSGDIGIARLLLAHGADLTPADPALNPLDAAAGVGKHPSMVAFLLQSGAKITRRTLVDTIAWGTAPGPRPDDASTAIMGQLISAGALKGISEDEAAELLILACQKQNPAILNELLNAGLSPLSRINSPTGKGPTALDVIRSEQAGLNGAGEAPLLDMLEKAVTEKSKTTPASPAPGGVPANPTAETQPGPATIKIDLKVIEIEDDVYRANEARFDTALKKGDSEFFNNLKGVDFVAMPTVSTKPGLKADVDIVREFPYPIKFDPAELVSGVSGPRTVIPMTATDFVTKDVGIRAEITPTINPMNSSEPGKIVLNGKISVSDFEGFTKSNVIDGPGMPSFSTRESLFVEELDDHQQIGISIPGVRGDEKTITEKDNVGKISLKTEPDNKRLILFVSASRSR